jgi:hypothetical protein
MSIFSNHFRQATSWVDPAGAAIGRNDPILKPVLNYLTKKEGPPGPTPPPTQDTAANSALQQQQQLLRRRGIMGNVFAGNAAAPATASKTALGT